MLLSIAIIAYGIFFDSINAFTIRLFQKRYGKIVVGLCSAVACGIIITVISIMSLMVNATNKANGGNEVLIVLGCKVNGEEPCNMLSERLVAAKAYLDEHEDAVCIVSGGKGADEGISEAECMYNWLVNSGIDGGRIYLEDKSTSTLENIEYSAEIMNKENLGTNVAIATNEFHIYRAGTVAEKNGLTYSAVPARTEWWLVPTYSVREMYGIILTSFFS